MNKHHKEILKQVKVSSKKDKKDSGHFNLNSYLGTDSKQYHIGTGTRIKITKKWAKENKEISHRELEQTINSLYKGKSFEEKSIASGLIASFPKYRAEMDLSLLDKWLGELTGWAEIDILCAMAFDAKDLLPRWQEWKKLLTKLSNDKYIGRRRASLIFLVRPVRQSDNDKFSKKAFGNVEKLKNEKGILITKAVSWVLRDMIKNHRKEVESYLKENKETLPKIAVRETTNKLKTGKK